MAAAYTKPLIVDLTTVHPTVWQVTIDNAIANEEAAGWRCRETEFVKRPGNAGSENLLWCARMEQASLVTPPGTNYTTLTYAATAALTIASDTIAVTQVQHTVDGESAAADDLATITGGSAGQTLLLRCTSAARPIRLTHAIGANKIQTPNAQPVKLTAVTDVAHLISDGTQWTLLCVNRLDTVTTLTIATDAVAATAGASSYLVDGEGAAADDLSTITGGVAGQVIYLRNVSAARPIRLTHAIGANRIQLPNAEPVLLTAVTDIAVLESNGTQWTLVAANTLATITELTIASDAIAVTGVGTGSQATYTVDTESDAASDNLSSITGGVAGQRVCLRLSNAARNVVVTHSIGANGIATPYGKSITLDLASDWVELLHNGSQWTVIAESAVTDTGWLIADPGTGQAIPVTRSGVCAITQNGAETNTVAAPSFVGQWLTIVVDVDTSGARTITCATTFNQTGNNTAVMSDAGDMIHLVAVQIAGVPRWKCIATDGVTLTTV